jgi:uncharacterized protein (TIGR02996 family)
MRTFELVDHKSPRFWSIDVQGDRLTVTSGEVGTPGHSHTETFMFPETVEAEAARLIREKTAEGYVETTLSTVTSQELPFVRALVADPSDETAWSAYADFLTERGDPRGEFMQVQRALEDESLNVVARKELRDREEKLLGQHEAQWVGKWAGLFPVPEYENGYGQVNHTGGRRYEFKRGLLTTVHFGELTVAAARAFVKAPETRFVRELFVGTTRAGEEFEPGPDIPEDAEEDEAALHALLRWPRLGQIRRFQLGWQADENYRDRCHFRCRTPGNLAYDFVRQMPDVEEVLVFARVLDARGLLALPMPRLRVLQLYHGQSYPLEVLARNPSLTNLTHLFCHPRAAEFGDEPYIRLAELRAICRSPHLKALTHLRLRLADFEDFGAEELVESGILRRLKVLDLRHGCMTDDDARLLATCPDLQRLEFLDLSRNAMNARGTKALRKTGVPVELGYQHTGDPGDGSAGDEYLYEGDME